MAMVDDPDWLLSHIRHSFITSDDTGMCEMVIQDNDLLTLDQHRKRLQEQSQEGSKQSENTMNRQITKSPGAKSYTAGSSFSGGNSPEKSPKIPLAPSPDILSGWDFGVRRRSNTAQKLERIRKERQNRVKVKTVHWKQMPERFVSEHLDSMFEKKDLRSAGQEKIANDVDTSDMVDSDEQCDSSYEDKATLNNIHANLTTVTKMQLGLQNEANTPVQTRIVASTEGFNVESNQFSESAVGLSRIVPSKPSALSKQLEESIQLAHNPFKDYAKFDGRGHEGSTVTQRINMFVYVYGESPPTRSMPVVVLVVGAKIVDLIGLTCWRYVTENIGPELKRDDVQGYSLHIAEDDGEVDYGFPALENNEPVSKFSFPSLALVEKHQLSNGEEGDGKFRESVFVKVNDYAGFSLIQVDNLTVTMGEVLKKAIKRRKGNKYVGVYRLEYQDRPGVVLDEDQTLDSTGVMEFCMVREHSARSAHNYPPKGKKPSSIAPDAKSNATTAKSHTVQFLSLMSSS